MCIFTYIKLTKNYTMKNFTITISEKDLKVLKRALLKEQLYCEERNISIGEKEADETYENIINQTN